MSNIIPPNLTFDLPIAVPELPAPVTGQAATGPECWMRYWRERSQWAGSGLLESRELK